MSKQRITMLLAGTLALPQTCPAYGNDVRTVSQERGFAWYLPAPSAQVPWLNFQTRTGFQSAVVLGGDIDSVGRLALPATSHTLMSAHRQPPILAERASP